MQIIFMELLQNFSFAPDPEQSEIIRAAAAIVTPMFVFFGFRVVSLNLFY